MRVDVGGVLNLRSYSCTFKKVMEDSAKDAETDDFLKIVAMNKIKNAAVVFYFLATSFVSAGSLVDRVVDPFFYGAAYEICMGAVVQGHDFYVDQQEKAKKLNEKRAALKKLESQVQAEKNKKDGWFGFKSSNQICGLEGKILLLKNDVKKREAALFSGLKYFCEAIKSINPSKLVVYAAMGGSVNTLVYNAEQWVFKK